MWQWKFLTLQRCTKILQSYIHLYPFQLLYRHYSRMRPKKCNLYIGWLWVPHYLYRGRVGRAVSIWSHCLGAAIVDHTLQDILHTVEYTLVQTSCFSPCRQDMHKVPAPCRKSYTLTMENESGDIMKVSKVWHFELTFEYVTGYSVTQTWRTSTV